MALQSDSRVPKTTGHSRMGTIYSEESVEEVERQVGFPYLSLRLFTLEHARLRVQEWKERSTGCRAVGSVASPHFTNKFRPKGGSRTSGLFDQALSLCSWCQADSSG